MLRGLTPAAVMILSLVLSSAPGLAQAPALPADYELAPFRLPDPSGKYALGTRSFTVQVSGAPALHVTVWYPASAHRGSRASYFTAAEWKVEKPAIVRNFRWPARTLDNLAKEPTHASEDAPLAKGKFPVVIFSHGYWSYPRQNSVLMEALASHGYLVFSLAHPGDSADLPTLGGVDPTVPYDRAKTPDSKALDAFWSGPTDAARRAAFPGFWTALRGGRLLASLARWRSDIIRLTGIINGKEYSRDFPQDLARAVDRNRFAFAGMSFGGSASASACEKVIRCRATVNLDGLEFDRSLYNRGLRAPLLLIQSDWHLYPNAGSKNACFTVYDYAYQPWSGRSSGAPIYRFAVKNIRHMGLTDLVLAPRDRVRDELFGTADGVEVVSAVNSTVLSFLDSTLKGRKVSVRNVAAHFPLMEPHAPFEKQAVCTAGAER